MRTYQGTRSASDQGKSSKLVPPIPGGAHLTSMPYFDPTDGWLYNLLVPSGTDDLEIPTTEPKLLQSMFRAPDLRCNGEVEWVQPAYDKIAGNFGLLGSNEARANGRKWYVNGVEALATLAHQSDIDGAYFPSSSTLPLLIWENKGSETTTVHAAAQAAAYASGVAMSLLRSGLEWSKVAVPVVTCNGLHLRFGATIVLYPSLPVYVPLSHDLNLHHDRDALLAAKYLMLARNHVKGLAPRINQSLRRDGETIKMLLSLERYHVKKLVEERHLEAIWLGDGLHRLFRIFGSLQADEHARKVVEFPVAVRNPDENTPEDGDGGCFHPALIFDNLCWEDYPGGPFRVGLPDATAKGGAVLWGKTLHALREAIESVHRAGVRGRARRPVPVQRDVERDWRFRCRGADHRLGRGKLRRRGVVPGRAG